MYGMLTYSLIKYLNSLIVVIIPCFILVFQEAFIDSIFVRYISYLFPVIINGIILIMFQEIIPLDLANQIIQEES